MDTLVKYDNYLHPDSYLRTDNLTSGQLFRRQLNCSPTDKKEKQKSPRFAFLKISFTQRTFGTFAFAPNRTSQRRAKAKEPNLPTLYSLNLN